MKTAMKFIIAKKNYQNTLGTEVLRKITIKYRVFSNLKKNYTRFILFSASTAINAARVSATTPLRALPPS